MRIDNAIPSRTACGFLHEHVRAHGAEVATSSGYHVHVHVHVHKTTVGIITLAALRLRQQLATTGRDQLFDFQ